MVRHLDLERHREKYSDKDMGKYSDVEPQLIEEVRKYPCLWDTNDPDYKNKIKKENAWVAVTSAVNTATGKSYKGE